MSANPPDLRYHKTMKARKHYDKQAVLQGLNIELTVEEAKRIRAALSDLDGEDLDAYGGILEALRKAIPQQWEWD